MKKIFSLLVLAAMMLFSQGCGVLQKGDGAGDASSESYSQSVDILNVIWENTSEDDRFPCFGGSQEEPVMDAPGSVDVTDSNMISYTLLVPEDLQENVTDAASLVHMMNGNTFTGAALKIQGTEVEKAAENVKDSIVGNQFVCGFSERLTVMTAGDYILYAFGSEENITSFQSIAESKVNGVKVIYNQFLE